jgi:undecaprenyl-diphosphatase
MAAGDANASASRWGRLTGWLGRADLVVLLAALAVATSVWAFLAIADRATDGPPGHLDERLLRELRRADNPAEPVGPGWLQEAARDITALGGYTVLTLVVGAVLGFLVIGRHFPAAILVAVATTGGWLLSVLLKDLYDRPRPDLVPHLTRVASSSFPSGHAMLSAVVYLTLGALLARLVPRWRAKLYFVAVAVMLALLVGSSRVYLGVHYPTDVAAGWAAGVAWATLCWLAARRLQREGAVDRRAD